MAWELIKAFLDKHKNGKIVLHVREGSVMTVELKESVQVK